MSRHGVHYAIVTKLFDYDRWHIVMLENKAPLDLNPINARPNRARRNRQHCEQKRHFVFKWFKKC